MSRRDGFTLLEVCLVVVIALLLFGLAIPSIQGLFAEQKLKKTFEDFDDFVRQVQTRSVTERRAFVMIWDGDGITVQADEPTDEDALADGDYFAFSGGAIGLERPAALQKDAPVEWLFWRSGTCEPAIVHYEGDAGSWSVSYDPLTVRGTFIDQVIK